MKKLSLYDDSIETTASVSSAKTVFSENDVLSFGHFIRDNYHGTGAPKLISYNHIKYPHGTIDEIFKIWLKEKYG